VDLAPLIALAKQYEGLHKAGPDGLVYPYICPAGYPTQGYGHLVKDMGVPPITIAQANEWLEKDVMVSLSQTLALCPNLTGNRLLAITDFTFNLGSGRLKASTLRRKILAEEWDEVPEQLMRWVRGGGRVLPGLVARRTAEVALWGKK